VVSTNVVNYITEVTTMRSPQKVAPFYCCVNKKEREIKKMEKEKDRWSKSSRQMGGHSSITHILALEKIFLSKE
jgi:hypothetical protein